MAKTIAGFYAKRREVDRAISEYRRGIGIAPNDLDLKNGLAEMYLESGALADAEALTAEVLKSNPKHSAARLNRARIWLRQGRTTDAINELRAQISDAPENALAHLALGSAYAQNGELYQAQQELEAALKYSPDMSPAIRALVDIHSSLGHAKLAQQYAEQLVQLEPTTGHRLLLGRALVQAGEINAARKQFNMVKELSPQDVGAHLGLASTYVVEKQFKSADKEFEIALQLKPDSLEALQAFSTYLTSRGQAEQAISRVRQYVDKNPANNGGHLILASALIGAKKYREAKLELERSLQLDPQSVAARIALGKVHQQLGEFDLAIVQCEQALRMQPRSVSILTMMGDLYLQRRDLEGARKYYEQALAINPDFGIAAANLAWVHALRDKDLEIAMGLAQHAKRLMPETPAVSDTLAWLYYKRGEYGLALPLLRECVKKMPESPTYRYHLGMVLIGLGNKTSARSELEAALRLNPSSEDIAQVRSALKQTN